MGIFNRFKKKSEKNNEKINNQSLQDKIKSDNFEKINEKTSEKNNNNILNKDSNNNSKDAFNFKYLDELIHSNNREINLNSNIVLDPNEKSIYEHGIEINIDNLIINGNNYFIDAQGLTRIFKINSKNITLKNIYFKNAKSDKGGAILNQGDNLEISECNFEKNYSKKDGGSIYNTADSLKLMKNNFSENYAKWNGSSVYHSGKSISITKCNFKNNSVNGKGSCIYIKKSKVEIFNSEFKDNSSKSHGGTIYIKNSELKIYNSKFNNNESRKNAGVIYSEKNSITIEKSKFINNKSNSHGGVICSIKSNLNIKNNCVFENNFSSNNGGAIFNDKKSNLILKSNAFSKNSSNIGGVIYNNGSLELELCNLFENSADEYGVIFNDLGYLHVSNSIFFNNSSKKQTSSIWNNNFSEIYKSYFIDSGDDDIPLIFQVGNEDSSLNITNCLFLNNSIENKKIIQKCSGSSIIKNTKFITNNYWTNSYAIFNGNGEITILNTKFLQCDDFNVHLKNFNMRTNFNGNDIVHILDNLNLKNNLNSDSAPIFNKDFLKIRKEDNILDKIITTQDSKITFTDEIASNDWKGFLFLEELIKSKLNQNSSKDKEIKIELNNDIILHESEQNYYEGGIELNANNLIIEGNGHIIDASELSRIFLVTGGSVTLRNIKFKKGKYFLNYFDDEKCGGGAICSLHDSSIHILDCEFIENQSKKSGGVILNKGKSLKIERCLFKDNNSVEIGGAIYNNSHLDLNDNCTFKNNSAKNSGGAIYNDGDLFIIQNCSFLNNSSDNDGGAISDDNGVLYLKKSIFKNNTSFNDGGAININNESDSIELIFTDCAFEYNSGNNGGSLIHNLDLILENCIFKNNKAKSNGGAISNPIKHGFLTIDSCDFLNNSASINGGAIYNFDNILKGFNNCNFINNKSGKGGAIFFTGSSLELDKCKFISNKAIGESDSAWGGGIFKGSWGTPDFENTNIKNTSFENNHASIGGAICIQDCLNIFDSNFNNNSSADGGDSIINSGKLNLKNCNFKADKPNILLSISEINHTDCVFDENCKIKYINPQI